MKGWRAGQAIMRTLLGYIGKERQADSLVEKLLARFQAASGPAQWRNLAFCLTQARTHAYLRGRLLLQALALMSACLRLLQPVWCLPDPPGLMHG